MSKEAINKFRGRTSRSAVRGRDARPAAGLPGMSCGVVRVADGQTLRQAAVARGIDPDADRLIVGIPADCLAEWHAK